MGRTDTRGTAEVAPGCGTIRSDEYGEAPVRSVLNSLAIPWESLPSQRAGFHAESRHMTLVVALRAEDGLFLAGDTVATVEENLQLPGWSKILKPKWPALCGWSGDLQTAKWIERALVTE